MESASGLIAENVIKRLAASFPAANIVVKCREAGKLRSEGKEYVVQDGDVINFKFNV